MMKISITGVEERGNEVHCGGRGRRKDGEKGCPLSAVNPDMLVRVSTSRLWSQAMRRITIALLLLPVPVLSVQAKDDPQDGINLLRLPTVKLEETTALENERAGLKALTDDDPNTVAVATAPFDVVYGFGGATVAPEKLVVRLPNPLPKGAGACKVEVWASTASPHAGFQLLRSTPVQAKGEAQAFPFPATAAKWLLLRFLPASDTSQIAVAEVAIFGREGPPATHYEFNQ